jgi:hypothetical protein
MDLATIARREGLLALEETVNKPGTDPFLKVAVNFIIDGIDSELVKEILKTIMETEQYTGFELLKNTIIIEGVLSVQAGENPILIRRKLPAFLGLDYVIKAEEEAEKQRMASWEDLRSKIKGRKPFPESEPFEALTASLSNRNIAHILKEVDMNQLARALETCRLETIEKIMNCLTRRLAGFLIDEIQRGHPHLDVSFQCQNEIVAIYERLASEGELEI